MVAFVLDLDKKRGSTEEPTARHHCDLQRWPANMYTIRGCTWDIGLSHYRVEWCGCAIEYVPGRTGEWKGWLYVPGYRRSSRHGWALECVLGIPALEFEFERKMRFSRGTTRLTAWSTPAIRSQRWTREYVYHSRVHLRYRVKLLSGSLEFELERKMRFTRGTTRLTAWSTPAIRSQRWTWEYVYHSRVHLRYRVKLLSGSLEFEFERKMRFTRGTTRLTAWSTPAIRSQTWTWEYVYHSRVHLRYRVKLLSCSPEFKFKRETRSTGETTPSSAFCTPSSRSETYFESSG